MTHPVLARAADFQAAWYFSLVLGTILLIVCIAAGYALAGARRLWRDGVRGPAAILVGATVVSLLGFLGLYATAIGGLFASQGGGGA